MIKAIIVEDEMYTREGLKSQLADLETTITVIGECESVNEAVTVTKACQPDLVFLDINLKDGTGFDYLEQVNHRAFKIIFITAYDSYAMKALKVGALDYILKPIETDELANAIQKVLETNQTDYNSQLTVTKESLKGENRRIVLSTQEGYQIIDFDELMFCQSDAGYTTFHLSDQRSFIVSKPLKLISDQLPESLFIRVHQSFLVNVHFIDRYDKARYLYLKNNAKIPVSTRRKEEVMARVFGK